MGFFSNLMLLGLAGIGISKMRKNAKEEDARNRIKEAENARKREEEEIRKNTPCFFEDGFSQLEFNDMVYRSGKNIKRLIQLSTDGPVIYGTVESQSGISTWKFTVDFNNYGHVTGKYWLISENENSAIPSIIADRIRDSNKSFYSTYNDSFYYRNSNSFQTNNQKESSSVKCPICGKSLHTPKAKYCEYCGNPL